MLEISLKMINISSKSNQRKAKYLQIFKEYTEFKFIQNQIYEQLGGTNTWCLQKCPKNAIKWIHEILMAFQEKVMEMVSDLRQMKKEGG